MNQYKGLTRNNLYGRIPQKVENTAKGEYNGKER